MTSEYLKKETEEMICAAQEQALRTNSVKCYIDKTSDSRLSKLCGEISETVWHIVSGCANLAQKEYKKCHECGEKWHEYKPLPVIENDQITLVWDSTIATDNRLNTTIVLKYKHQ